ncbi:MAG: CHASE domain-containing protein, partial [Gemmatimonadaceae bacterium]|nr:CHASE domain-containing protein [Gemmatimonadaceae bacterium]
MMSSAGAGSIPKNTRGARRGAPYLVLAVSLLITTGATAYVGRTLSARDHLRFNTATNHARDRIVTRIDTSINMLRGADGLFASRFPVKPDEFTLYVARLDVRSRYPGIQGIGFSVRFREMDRELLEKIMRGVGEPEFRTWPRDGTDEEHHAIVYLEPRDRPNRQVIGFDMSTESVQRQAMQRARDTGNPAATGKVTLLQDADSADPQPGFLIYSPVYKGGSAPSDVAARPESLLGFVYAPFRMGDLFNGIFQREVERWLEFQIYDSGDRTPTNLLYASSANALPSSRFAKDVSIDVAGRAWTLRFQARPEFQSAWARMAVPITAIGGGVLSLAFFLFTGGQVNARVRAERLLAELHRSQQALIQSESKFRRLSDANLVGVCFASLDGRVLDANDEWLRIVGLDRAALAAGLRWEKLIPPESGPRIEQAISDLRQRGATPPFELELLRPDGARVPVLTGTAMLEGTDEGSVSLAVDLTTRKEAERQLLAAKEVAEAARTEAETANRLKDEFLATMSHELRTPLNAILGWTQLLSDPSSESRDVAHGLAVIDRNARAQAQLVEDLLDVSRIVAGKLRLEFQPVELAQVVEAAVQTIRPTADVKGVTLVINLRRTCCVAGDAARLQQVAWNLLSNAVKFTPRGGRVEVDVTRVDDEVRLTVRDTGKGIAADFLPYVFERFRQGDSSTTRKFGGLGLGLGIVRHLVQLHGGA